MARGAVHEVGRASRRRFVRAAARRAEQMTFVEHDKSEVRDISIGETQHRKQSLGRHHLDGAKLGARDERDEVAVGGYFVIGEALREALGEIVAKLVDQRQRWHEEDHLATNAKVQLKLILIARAVG